MKSPVVVLAMLSVIVALAVAPPPAGAQAKITVTDDGVAVSFPSAMNFAFSATSSSPINDVRVHYQVDRMNYASVTSESWPKFNPGTALKTVWTWDMRRSSLPPSSTVQYWWTAANAAGDTVETQKKKASFEDTRYRWRSVVTGNTTLYWYQGDDSFAAVLVRAVQDALVRLNQDTGVTLTDPAKLFIYANSRDLQGAMIFPREWTGGATYAEFSVIVIGISTNQTEWGKRAIVHELGHMAVNHLTFSPYETAMPTWLNEGMAVYTEGTPDPMNLALVSQALSQGKLISLRSLSSPFSALPAQANLSYAESYSVVNYLIKTYGRDRMLNLFSTFRQGATPDEALGRVYGFNQDTLYTQWVASLGGKTK